MMDYESLLNRLEEKLPRRTAEEKGRFKVPAPRTKVQGNRTFILNFKDVTTTCNRTPQHLLKYLSRELATSANLDSQGQAIFTGKFGWMLVGKKVEAYIKEFVMCPECGKPDTKLIKIDRQPIMKCEACGAKHPVRTL